MRDLVEYLARSLAAEPDRITVEELRRPGGVVYEIRTAPADTGKLIGRGGRTVKALRRVVQAVGRREGVRVELEVLAEDE